MSKKPCFGTPFTFNMKSQNIVEISITAFLLNVLITVTEIESENVSLSDM